MAFLVDQKLSGFELISRKAPWPTELASPDTDFFGSKRIEFASSSHFAVLR